MFCCPTLLGFLISKVALAGLKDAASEGFSYYSPPAAGSDSEN